MFLAQRGAQTTLELQILNADFYVEPSLLAFLYEQQHGAVHRHVYPSFRCFEAAPSCRGSPERLLGGTKQLHEAKTQNLSFKICPPLEALMKSLTLDE